MIDYNDQHKLEQEVPTAEECFPYKDRPSVTWINVDGLHEVDVIENIGNHFNIHPLIMEDILHIGQRPKFEDFGNFIYIVLNSYQNEKDELQEEQLSIVLGSNYVITFQERAGDEFDPVRERIRSGRFQMKKRKADYLAYALIDAVVDNYFVILERLGEKIEDLEEELLTNPTPTTLHVIHSFKRKMITLRKSVWPLREVINSLQRSESPLFHKSTSIYLKDIYDHTIQVIDTIETFRDMVSEMLDTYLSYVSNKMNEIMKVLTIIATIFIPLTFLAGVYGMNFEFMPELKWRGSYPIVWIIMIVSAIGMIFYFRKKKWF